MGENTEKYKQIENTDKCKWKKTCRWKNQNGKMARWKREHKPRTFFDHVLVFASVCRSVLVCSTDLVKISDFGTMRPWDENQKSMQMSFAGTVAWMAPEVVRNENCTEKIDVWAFGVILWELLVGLHPYPGLDSTSIIWGIGSEKLLGLPLATSMPGGLKLLQTQCWSVKPRNRPSFAEISRHLEIAARELTTMTEQQFFTHQVNWKTTFWIFINQEINQSINQENDQSIN